MKSRWDPTAFRHLKPLEALVYRSRLIGEEEALGLWGGGNTSLKGTIPDFFGEPQEVLWVKGSGSNLKHCEASHFAVLRLTPLRRIIERRAMTDEEMVAFLEQCLFDPKSPRPSIEALLHAFIPEAAIDHTHADAILYDGEPSNATAARQNTPMLSSDVTMTTAHCIGAIGGRS